MLPLKLLIITQEDFLYLPHAVATVCRQRQQDIVGVVTLPAMSTHGSSLNGLKRHLRLFGVSGVVRLATRVMWSETQERIGWYSRKSSLQSIRRVANYYNIPFLCAPSVRSKDFDAFIDKCNADLLVSISCPQIIPRRVRQRFKHGAINVHSAPLPRYRGLMPGFWVLRNGEQMTAVTVHDLGDKLDNGDILLQRAIEIRTKDTWDSLVRRTKEQGALALLDAVGQIEENKVNRRENLDEDATYFSFPTRKDRRAFLASGRRFF